MPKNKGSGGKRRKKGKSMTNKPRELVYKDDGQEYGQITKKLGNGYMEVLCFTGNGTISRRAHIRGKMRKKVWMAVGDIVLINIRDYEDSTCDIVMKYTNDEARILRTRRELPENVDINKNDDDKDIIFDDGGDSGDDSEEEKDPVPEQNRKLDMPESDSEDDDSSTVGIDDL